MSQSKKDRIDAATLAIAGAHYTIARCDELLAALATHTGKLVDKRFFEKHFSESNEYRTYTTYELSGKQYGWDSYTHRIYLGRYTSQHAPDARGVSIAIYGDYEYVELNTRETAHIIERVQAKKAAMLERIDAKKSLLAQLEAVDNEAIITDLIAVYNKHGAPVTWHECLDAYEVKYPRG